MSSRRGSWRASGRGTRGGGRFTGNLRERTTSSQSSKPCVHFQRGTCSYGARCRFSHEIIGSHGGGANRGNHADDEPITPEQAEARTSYFDWKTLLTRFSFDIGSVSLSLIQVWADAAKILDGDGRAWHQQLIKDLINEDWSGPDYINNTIALNVLTDDITITSIADDFVKVIAHPSLLNCLSVATYVGELYFIAGGANGVKALDFIAKYCKGLLLCHEKNPRLYTPEKLETRLQMLATFLGELLRRRQRLALQDGLDDIFEAMDGVAEILNYPNTMISYTSCADLIVTLRRMVKLSTARLTPAADSANDQPGTGALAASRPGHVFLMDLELPGGRHDNDHVDIGRIKILPTADEMLSTREEYLPSTDFRQPHFHDDPVQRYLDTHFRLLRHDIFGPVVDLLHQALLSFTDGSRPLDLHDGNVRAYIYHRATISHLSVDDRRGFESHVSFSPPHHLRQKSLGERKAWWEQSKRLEQGTVACFVSTVDGRPTPLLLVISDRCTNTNSSEKDKNNNPSEKNKGNLVSDVHRATIRAKPATPERADLGLLTRLYHHKMDGVLIHFPDLIPATFKPILENLQDMMVHTLPFRESIIPDVANAWDATSKARLPKYARRADFLFCLGPILLDKTGGLKLRTTASKDSPKVLDAIVDKTGLDRGQASALVMALTTEYPLLQGPPGTGKSFLGVKLLQVLLASKKMAGLGPIVVMCYTNHALDQFLQHLLAVGVTRIIRIGGRSRLPELDQYNLVEVSRQTPKYKGENQVLGATYSELDAQRRSLGNRLAGLHALRKPSSSRQLDRYLAQNHPQIHAHFFPDDRDGFVTVGDPISAWLGNSWRGASAGKSEEAATAEQLNDLGRRASRDVKSLSQSERRLIFQSWLDGIRAEQTDSLFEEIRHIESTRQLIDGVHNEANRRVLLNADVIGITATGLARDIATLRCLNAKVVVCEEAAEVLEPYLISALMPGVEHLIQIGDHQQLRPQITCRSLSMETSRGALYQLDRSQFERLAVGQPGLAPLPVAQLNVQRRMRPQISQLIRPTMYPRLEDHHTVMELPDVVGMRSNLFWLTHEHVEDAAGEDKLLKSHSNSWEVGMVVALVRHLVRQGAYKTTDIAVLTPYSGQLNQLRIALAQDFEILLSEQDEDMLARDGMVEAQDASSTRIEKKKLVDAIRLATVDNFQGEESKVVVVSLVRSNDRRKVGFLKTSNRINVLLSRAQHGMYLIGNADTYANVAMWVDVQRQLEAGGSIGTALELCCPRHKDTLIRCSEPDDFARFSPDGGCSLRCDRRLDGCGHQCSARCHSDTLHKAFACIQPCPRIRTTCDHGCPKLCGEGCGPCRVMLSDVALPCGHEIERLRCFEALDLGKIACKVRVQKQVPTCRHTVEVACSVDVAANGFKCHTPCQKILDCGHRCPGSCGACPGTGSLLEEDNTHKRCNRQCKRPYGTCDHVCQSKCHSGRPCTPCAGQCEVRCAHSRCERSCLQPCDPCIENCAWSCEHQGDCPMPCAAPCTRLPCDERCSNVLECGHQCPSICGETCPKGYCQECGQHLGARVDLLEFKDYRDIDLGETPIVVLACGHFFTAESLDGLMKMNEVYDQDPLTGHFTGLRMSPASLSVPCCPDCKKPIRQFATNRFGRAINKAVMDEISQKFHIAGLGMLGELESRIRSLADECRSRQSAAGDPSMRLSSHKEAETLKREIGAFRRKMGAEQQPTKKLSDAVRVAKGRRRDGSRSLDEKLAGLSLEGDDGATMLATGMDMQVILGGQLAGLRLEDIVISATLLAKSTRRGNNAVRDSELKECRKRVAAFLRDGKDFIEECRKARLSRMAVQGIAIYARMVKASEGFFIPRGGHLAAAAAAAAAAAVSKPTSSPSTEKEDYDDTARGLLGTAADLCKEKFEDAEELRGEIEGLSRLYERERYEVVTAEEIAAIKTAMVSGAAGIAKHSGHWYKCCNGHSFAIGECGMPMEQARCPECQAPIGGQNHTLVEGVARDTDME